MYDQGYHGDEVYDLESNQSRFKSGSSKGHRMNVDSRFEELCYGITIVNISCGLHFLVSPTLLLDGILS